MKSLLNKLTEKASDSNIDKKEFSCIYSLMEEMKKYWKTYDIDNDTRHCEIFTALYMANNKSTYLDLVIRFDIGQRTLSRYIKRYNDLAKKLIDSNAFESKQILKEI